jgi:hypothetical protein
MVMTLSASALPVPAALARWHRPVASGRAREGASWAECCAGRAAIRLRAKDRLAAARGECIVGVDGACAAKRRPVGQLQAESGCRRAGLTPSILSVYYVAEPAQIGRLLESLSSKNRPYHAPLSKGRSNSPFHTVGAARLLPWLYPLFESNGHFCGA